MREFQVMPSYSMTVKKNLMDGLEMRRARIKIAVLGMTQAMARLQSEGAKARIVYTSENGALIRLIKLYLDKEGGIASSLSFNKNKGSSSRKRLNLVVGEVEACADFLGLSLEDGELSLSIPDEVHKNKLNMRDYIIGFFVASGFIAHPQKRYHLEFVCRTDFQAEEIMVLLEKLSFRLKTVKRLSSTVVYVKDSQVIADLLSAMEATAVRLTYEDEMIVKQINNKVNRIVNCEMANIEKSSETSVRQVNAIKYIQDTIGLYQLDEKLRIAAELRLEYTLLSLRELGLKMNPPLGKSGMNHRMTKLEEIAQNLQKRQKMNVSKEYTYEVGDE